MSQYFMHAGPSSMSSSPKEKLDGETDAMEIKGLRELCRRQENFLVALEALIEHYLRGSITIDVLRDDYNDYKEIKGSRVHSQD